MKTNFLVLMLVCLFSYFPFNLICKAESTLSDALIKQATDWIDQSLITKNNDRLVCDHDLQIVLNLFYLSYQRSRATLESQECAITLLDNLWQSWQNIAQRRRNPSKQIPYVNAGTQLMPMMHTFSQLLAQHETMSSAYDELSELILKGDGLENKLLKKNIEYIKEQARTEVTHALLDVQSHIVQLSEYLKQHRHMRVDDEQILDDLEQTRGKLIEYIHEQLPILAFNSYVKTDNLFISMSEKQWKALRTTQELSNMIWRAVETARAEYYLAHYRTLYKRMQELDITPTSWPDMGTHAQELLPHPDLLPTF